MTIEQFAGWGRYKDDARRKVKQMFDDAKGSLHGFGIITVTPEALHFTALKVDWWLHYLKKNPNKAREYTFTSTDGAIVFAGTTQQLQEILKRCIENGVYYKSGSVDTMVFIRGVAAPEKEKAAKASQPAVPGQKPSISPSPSIAQQPPSAQVPATRTCPRCKGSGKELVQCKNCSGAGELRCHYTMQWKYFWNKWETECNGGKHPEEGDRKKNWNVTCKGCNGRGFITCPTCNGRRDVQQTRRSTASESHRTRLSACRSCTTSCTAVPTARCRCLPLAVH